ncbi:MAG TPA: cytidylate kinase-like family protein [Ktedonobacterales bacterium]
MNAQWDGSGEMRAVTISRQYGSGGGEIGARLARKLGWQLVDHEIVARVAGELRIAEAEAYLRDEHADSFFERMWGAMRLGAPEGPIIDASLLPINEERVYHEALCRVVEAAARAGQAVIIGRGAQAVLKGWRDVLHVRVVAPPEQRLAYVMRREGLDAEQAQRRMRMKDRDRVRYMQSLHHCGADDPMYYDLIINTGVLDLDGAVDLISVALERKSRRLATPDEELGPGAGIARYPGTPGDLRRQSSASGVHARPVDTPT